MILKKDADIGNLCNNADVGEDGKFIGQPTDIALLDVVLRSGLSDEREVSLLDGGGGFICDREINRYVLDV